MTPEKIRFKCLELAAGISMTQDPYELSVIASKLVYYVRNNSFPEKAKPEESAERDDGSHRDRIFAQT